MSDLTIRIHGATQNNLKNLDLELPLNELIVITGVSGSGKSSLAFDTLYAEGQRRYVETFSPYARQFLDRMDKPQVERIEGIPPAIAIDQTNPVRTSRSTVGTMTELNDHLKLLFARTTQLYCHRCGQPVVRDTPDTIADQLLAKHTDQRVAITFPIRIPGNFTRDEVLKNLEAQGYSRIHDEFEGTLLVTQDRLRLAPDRRDRLIEDWKSRCITVVATFACFRSTTDTGHCPTRRRCTAHLATSNTATLSPTVSPSTHPSVRARPAVVSDAPWASTTDWWCPTKARASPPER